MGFDMTTADKAAKKVSASDDPSNAENYCRGSIGGGGPQAQLLVDAGMGYWSEPTGDWPKPEDYSLTVNPDYDYGEDSRQYLGEPGDIERFWAAHTAHLKATYSETPGIAVYKLCGTNDGWWVTKAECASALKLWEKAGEPDVDNGNGDTIPFLRAGADHGGFQVW